LSLSGGHNTGFARTYRKLGDSSLPDAPVEGGLVRGVLGWLSSEGRLPQTTAKTVQLATRFEGAAVTGLAGLAIVDTISGGMPYC